MRIFVGCRLYLESAAGSERKSFTTFEACGACIKFPVVSDDGSDPACDDAYIPEPIHPRYRPSRVEFSILFTGGPSQDSTGGLVQYLDEGRRALRLKEQTEYGVNTPG
jgi:hypothetical protein